MPDPSRVILIVDDNPVNGIATARSIHSLGYGACVVPGGAVALETLQREPVALILMDCQMPGMDGYQTASRIRQLEESAHAARIPIVALVASVFEGDQDRCRAAGMDDYLAKPFRLATLGATLRRWMDRVPQNAAIAPLPERELPLQINHLC